MTDSSEASDEQSDAAWIGMLFDQHADSLTLYASQLCSTPADAVQEAFMKLAERLNREDLENLGFRFRRWEYAVQEREPPLQWISIVYDRPEETGDVFLTAELSQAPDQTPVSVRSIRNAHEHHPLELLIACNESEFGENSVVRLGIRKSAPDGKKFSGLRISLGRIIELLLEKALETK